MKGQKTYPFFFIALFLSVSSFFPFLSFSPYLALLYRHSTRIKALWMGTLCGLILDFFGSFYFGLHTLQVFLVTLLVYRFRIYFVDRPIGLASYTTIISLTATFFFRFFLLFYKGTIIPFTSTELITDFIIMPVGDGCYAFFFFLLPPMSYRFLRKFGFLYLFVKKDRMKKRERLH